MDGGGAEKSCYMFANRLSLEFGYSVYIFLNEPRGAFLKFINPCIIVIPLFTFKNKYIKFLLNVFTQFNIFTFISLVYKIHKLKPQSLISFAEWPNLYAGLGKFFFSNQMSVFLFEQKLNTFINNYKFYGVSPIIKHLSVKECSKADKILACSQQVKLSVRQQIRDKPISVVYNPVDCKRSNQLSNQYCVLDINPTCINFVAIGRLERQKDYPTMLRAFEMAFYFKKNIVLYILGIGSEKNNLESLVMNFESKNSIHFTGFVENPFAYLKHSDVLIHSALFEGFGNVFVEALAIGVPILTTDCSSPNEIIINSTHGQIVPTEDVDALCKSILKQQKKNDFVIQSCKERARDFDIEKVFLNFKNELELA
jgi:glycosyltransferase involved in cell wall biosynthesis